MQVSELLLKLKKRISWNDIEDKPTTFTPPIATESELGGVKIGKGLDKTIDGTLSAKVDKSTKHQVLLSANNWTGDASPYNYAITINGMDENKNWEVTNSVTPLMTLEELEAFGKANIIAGTQTTNTINLIAYGEKPTIDINILVIVRED